MTRNIHAHIALRFCQCASWWALASCGSQGSQDAIIASIFSKIGETNRFFVEFGFNGASYEEGSGANSEALWRRGWRGLLLDGRRQNASINLKKAYIKSTTIVGLLKQNDVPRDLDYLSVDIDSADLWVLRAILSPHDGFRPRLVSVEYNSNYEYSETHAAALTLPDPATMPIVHGRASWNLTCYYGASPRALWLAAAERGYMLVAVEPLFDLFFVRRDIWHATPPTLGGGASAAAVASTWFPTMKRTSASSKIGKIAERLASSESHHLAQLMTARPNHLPMTISEAHNVLDYEEYLKTGSVCAARATATKTLRAYAEDYHRGLPLERRRCFKNLRQLETLACDPHTKVAVAKRHGEDSDTEQLGHHTG